MGKQPDQESMRHIESFPNSGVFGKSVYSAGSVQSHPLLKILSYTFGMSRRFFR